MDELQKDPEENNHRWFVLWNAVSLHLLCELFYNSHPPEFNTENIFDLEQLSMLSRTVMRRHEKREFYVCTVILVEISGGKKKCDNDDTGWLIAN